MSWTDERVALLRKMWGEGKTAAEIAKTLGNVTRNAVIGKAHRLKLSNRISPIQQNTKKTVKSSEPRQNRVTSAATRQPRPEVKVIGVKLTELKEKMCRWPLGDPQEEDFKFCGCDSVPGLPYCDGHARIAYQVNTRGRVIQPEEIERINAAAEAKEAANA